jgi:hypothetical protein
LPTRGPGTCINEKKNSLAIHKGDSPDGKPVEIYLAQEDKAGRKEKEGKPAPSEKLSEGGS